MAGEEDDRGGHCTAAYFLLTADYGSEPNLLTLLSYLMSDKPPEALNDAMQAQVDSPVWKLSKKRGDSAFNHKDFRTTFVGFGTIVSPTIFARRSLSYLMSDKPQEATNDAMQAQVVSPVWHIACYLQAVAVSALGMDGEAQVALKEGTMLES